MGGITYLLDKMEQYVFEMLCETVFLSKDIASALERPDLADQGGEPGGRSARLCELKGRSTHCVYDAALAMGWARSAKAAERHGEDVDMRLKLLSLGDYCAEIRRKLNGIRAEFESLSNPRTGEWWNDSSERGGRTD